MALTEEEGEARLQEIAARLVSILPDGWKEHRSPPARGPPGRRRGRPGGRGCYFRVPVAAGQATVNSYCTIGLGLPARSTPRT